MLPRQRKTRAILAILAIAAPRPVLRTTLSGLLWSRRDREQARASLRQAVHELQESLAPLGDNVLITDRNSLALRDAAAWIDVTALARATATRPDALALLDAGALLQDLVGIDDAFDRWRDAEQHRLIRGAVTVAEACLAARAAEHAAPSLMRAAAERIVALDPTHEAGWRAIMAAYAASGERAAAIEAFERCSAALAQRAQLAPSQETLALHASIRARSGFGEPAQAPLRPPEAARRGVRLGVMPFLTSGSDIADPLVFGLAEEITTAMSRFRWIYLIASRSLAAVQNQPGGERERLLRSVDLDFLLEGTIQRGPGRVRVNVRLLDMRGSGGTELLWAHRFDGSDADLLTLQDRIAAETVAQVDPKLLLSEGHRTATAATRDVTAYDLMLRAIPGIYRLEEAEFRIAGTFLEDAVARDPDFAAAHAWYAHWHMFYVGQGWASDPAAAMARAGALAERAVALDPADARGLTIAGHVRAFLQSRVEDGMALHERALSINPNLPLAWILGGLAFSFAGRHAEGLARIEEAHRLSPFDPHPFFYEASALVPHLFLSHFERVVELARRAIVLNPTFSATYKAYLTALGHLGPSAERDAVLARLLELEPGFNVRDALARSPQRREQDRALYAEGLRRAGLPENSNHPPAA